ncbi:MAG: polymerase subunit sigma-70 [Bacteroidetes bacterium]|nr:polymerase subunit sigma-70 [Bacteroidota bacterium]
MGLTVKEIHAMDAEQLLIEQIGQGNKQAFSRLYDIYAPALLGMISRMGNDEQKAEQILQATFLKIIGSLTKYNPTGERLFTRMLKIARVLAAGPGMISENKAVPEIQQVEHLVNEAAEGHYSLEKQQKSASFPEPHQPSNALDLVYFNGYSYAATAQQLGISMAELKIKIRKELKQRRTL